MVCVAVTYVIREGREAEAEGLFRELAEATRAEPGCVMYAVHRLPSDPRVFFLYEQYRDAAALEAHRAAEHFERLGKGRLWPITERREPQVYDLIV
jgi:quinol monooxygenase YgiN